MKGLILSLLIFVLYVMTSMVFSHIFKPKRHGKFFLRLALFFAPCFLVAYYLTPSNLWFLSLAWQASHSWLDQVLGVVILLLNIHNFMDWFFGFNGGFSTSLMLILLGKGKTGARSEELIEHYDCSQGMNQIHGWRLPRLEETGYLTIDQKTECAFLTRKGKLVAWLAYSAKKILNLGVGG